ncbi:MAG: zinc-binding dehydrogenase [Chloroflexi bacterium]|nr:zinc-binding dehydrogenase [Chloroflexota bacterium]
MRGVVFTGNSQLEIRDFPDPVPGPGEVVVGMRASGICGSDLNLYRKPSFERAVICGHEPCGVVLERGPGVSEQQAPIGERVMIHHYRGCNRCWLCGMGYTQMCRQAEVMGTDIPGGHAGYLVAPASTLVPLPDGLAFAEGAAIACGTGTAYAALKRLDVSGRDTLAIFGQGPVGLSATQLATAMGARVIAIDPAAERRALSREMGADVVLDPTATDAVEAIRDLTHSEGADATLDCSGNSEARVQCARAARPWGRACYVGAHGTATFEMTPDVIHRQLTMIGCWTFNPQLMAECARFAVDRKVQLGRVFTDTFSLDQAADAYQRVAARTMGKGVFLFD